MPNRQDYDAEPRVSRSGQTEPSSSGGAFPYIAIIVGLLVLIAAWVILPTRGIELPVLSIGFLTAIGLAFILFGAGTLMVTNLYLRVPSDMALVITGFGGPRVILDGGALVVPSLHRAQWVSLRTIMLQVVRMEKESLITKDNLRVHIESEFYLRVPKEEQAVKTAATQLGSESMNPDSIRSKLESSMISTMRQVAANLEFRELLAQRDKFVSAVIDHMSQDLQKWGLELVQVTISRLEQTPASALDIDNNIIDAAGARKIAEITKQERVARVQAEQEAERQVVAEQVKTTQFVSDQRVAEATAVAERERHIAEAQAAQQAAAAEALASAERQKQIARIQTEQATQLATVQQEQQVAVAQQVRERAEKEAEIERDQAVQVAARLRDIEVAKQETLRAQAEAERLAAEAQRAEREQAVTTVQVTAEAQRNKNKTVIAAQAQAEQQKLQRNVEVDVAAYQTIQAAKAAQAAAEANAAATITEADAAQKSASLRAEGQRIEQLVPVQVAQEQVVVDQARALIPVTAAKQQVEVDRVAADVQRINLENQSAHQEIARGLQVELARIEAEKEVGIAHAQAIGVALSSANMQLVGDPATVGRLLESLSRGQQFGKLLTGFTQTAPEGVLQVSDRLVEALTRKVSALGFPASPEIVKTFLEQAATEAATPTVIETTDTTAQTEKN